MKIQFIALLCVLGLSPFLTQCATKQDVRTTNMRMQSVDEKVKELKEQTVKHVQERQAKVSDRLDYLEAELLSIKGQLEESAHHNRLLKEEHKEQFAALKKQLKKNVSRLTSRLDAQHTMIGHNEGLLLKDKTDLLGIHQTLGTIDGALIQVNGWLKNHEQDIKKIFEARAKEAAERAAEAAKALAEAKQARVKATGPQEIFPDQVKLDKRRGQTKQGAAAGPAQTLYDRGLKFFKAKKYQDAHTIFAQLIKKHPASPLKVNAQFWLGDSLYGQGKYDQAILEYQKVVVDFPKHPKASAAMLKLALAFEKIGDRETAKIVYGQIVTQYPESDQKNTAEKRLKALK